MGSYTAFEAHAEVIVVPNAVATTDGNFNHGGGPVPVRLMQIYDASQFASLSQPVLITKFSYRPDSIPGPSGPLAFNVQVFASTTSQSVAGLSSTFAENIGADNTLVFSGTETLVTANLPGPGNTRQFDIEWPFTTPFLYDPAAGNLVLDFQGSSSSGPAIRWDAVMGDPTVNFVAAIGSATATSGNVLGFGFITQFTFQPVPQLSGDYNTNGVVDAADYVVWRNGLGTTYTQADYDVWRANFGQTIGSGAASLRRPFIAVPEPATLTLLIMAMVVHYARRRSTVS